MKSYMFLMTFIFAVPLGSTVLAQDQSLEGQLTALANEVRTLHQADRIIAGRKLRLDRVSSFGIPDANYDEHIESGMESRLKDILDESAKLLLKIEYGYLESESKTNLGKRVIQITAKIFEGGRLITKKLNEGELDPLKREVNNSADIGKMVAATMAPPDTVDHNQRLKATEAAFEKPTFSTVEKTRIIPVDKPTYAVELRKQIAGKGAPIAVPPENQRGMAFAKIDIGDTYDIVLYNYDEAADAVAKVEIDGLDAANAFNSDKDQDGKPVSYPGYLIPRAVKGVPGQHVVPGWLHTVKPGNDNVFQFVVNELGKGAASAKKARGKTGVVTVNFFDAYEPTEKPRGRNFGETGKGKPMKVDYSVKPMQVGTEPLSIISIRYSRKP